MKRRIALLVGTFVTLLVAYAVYHFSSGGLERLITPRAERQKMDLQPLPPAPAGPASGPGVDTGGVGLRIEVRDPKTGRLEGVYFFPRWDKRPDGQYEVSEPNVTIYHKGGERTYVTARRGVLDLEEVAKRWDVRKGDLHGSVTVWFDRNPQGGPPDASRERMRQIVRLYTDDIHLDNQRMTMYTDSRIVLFSDRADFFGNGLRIRWRDQPRELVRLEIPRGGQMNVYEMPEEFGASLPGLSSTPAGATRPGRKPAGIRTTSPADRITSGLVRLPATLATTAFAPAVAKTSPRGSARPAGSPEPVPMSNMYRAEFQGSIRVDYPVFRKESNSVDHGYVEGADKLALVFEWGQDSLRKPAPAEDQREAERSALARTASAPATASATNLPTSAAASSPASAPSRKGAPRASDPMIVTWMGPLVLEPFGYTEEPSPRTYEISAQGERVILGDSRTMASCRRFRYASPEQEGELEGEANTPARLVLSDGADVVCRRIEYQRDRGAAWLDGAGYMTVHTGAKFDELQALASLPAPLEPEANLDSIRWSRSMEALFAPEDRGGLVSGRNTIREANFVGDVKLVQASSGDFACGDSLQALLARDAQGKMYVRKAFVRGRVRARQAESEISGGSVTVAFVPASSLRDANATTQIAASRRGTDAQFGRLQPVTMEAEGDVVVQDGSAPDRVVARADRLSADILRRTATLWGRPAFIGRGQDQMTGAEIRLREVADANHPDQSAFVQGPGSMLFLVRRDLNGVELKTPRPIQIAWTESMDYSSARNEALFNGNVQLESAAASADEVGTDQMTCRSGMKIFFEKPDPNAPRRPPASPRPAAPSRPAVGSSRPGPGLTEIVSLESLADEGVSRATEEARAASTRPARKPALNVEGYSRRKLISIVANDDVVMTSNRVDPNGRLARRLKVTGDQLVYDPNQVRVFGRGTMLLEDYRAPEANQVAKASASAGEDLERPQYTAFWWDRLMSLSQKDRTVVQEGNVQMVHHSGQYVPRGANLPPWPELKGGRITVMRSDTVQVSFAAPAAGPSPASKPSALGLEGGPRIGNLSSIVALGDVYLEDGVRQKRTLSGQRMEYGRNPEIVSIWGSLPGQPKAAALMTLKDLDTNKRQEWSSSRILWYRASDKIVTEDGTGTGTR